VLSLLTNSFLLFYALNRAEHPKLQLSHNNPPPQDQEPTVITITELVPQLEVDTVVVIHMGMGRALNNPELLEPMILHRLDQNKAR